MPVDDIIMSDPGMAAVDTSVPARSQAELRQSINPLDQSNIVEWVVNHAANRTAVFGQDQLKISTTRALTRFKRPAQEIDQLFQQVIASDMLTQLEIARWPTSLYLYRAQKCGREYYTACQQSVRGTKLRRSRDHC